MATREQRDDQGNRIALLPVGRVVSLVPSLTEAVAATAPGLLVGATDWCTRPAGLGVRRIGGTKNPDLAGILALDPDLVLANEEENRAVDLAALREAGVPVWVTEIRTLEQAFRSLDAVLTTACGLERPRWLGEAEAAWGSLAPAAHALRAVVPVWRRPWMVLGRFPVCPPRSSADATSPGTVPHSSGPRRFSAGNWRTCSADHRKGPS